MHVEENTAAGHIEFTFKSLLNKGVLFICQVSKRVSLATSDTNYPCPPLSSTAASGCLLWGRIFDALAWELSGSTNIR